MRTPVFELHIAPMFRATDRDHMLRLFGEEFDSRAYVLYFEPPDVPEGGLGEEIVDSDQFDSEGIEKLMIRDEDGLRELPIPS